MSIVKKIIAFFKSAFNKQENIKYLEPPKQVINQSDKNNFLESLKIIKEVKKSRKKVETLICEGDGLGIQKKISY